MNLKKPIYTAVLSTLLLNGCVSTNTQNSTYEDGETILSMSEAGLERSIVYLTGDIYRFFDNHHSSLFVVLENEIILIDPLNVEVSKWIKKQIDHLFGLPVTHVLYSHGHDDHASGAAIFEGAEVISHKNTFDLITPAIDETLPRDFAQKDSNGNAELDPSEWTENFDEIDTDNNRIISGSEAYVFQYKNVLPPTQTYDADVHVVEVSDKKIEMHFVGGNHASDMSYIFFPDESLVFYVDVISLNALPFGELTWYSLEDSANTYKKALEIDAKIAVPSHGPIGTQEDVRALEKYMAALREGVKSGMEEGQTLEKLKETLLLEDYADWDYYDQRRPQNITGMYRALVQEKE